MRSCNTASICERHHDELLRLRVRRFVSVALPLAHTEGSLSSVVFRWRGSPKITEAVLGRVGVALAGDATQTRRRGPSLRRAA
jgi:hypothetical protein